LDDFGDFKSEKMGDSMLSNQEEHTDLFQTKNNEDLLGSDLGHHEIVKSAVQKSKVELQHED
jgi:hypothetical protein